MKRIAFILLLLCAQNVSFSNENDGNDKTSTKSELLILAETAELMVIENPTLLDSAILELKSKAIAIGDSEFIMMADLLRGIELCLSNNHGLAIRQFYGVYNFAKRNNDIQLQINSLNNMAGVYAHIGQPRKAQDALEDALSLVQPESDKYLQGSLTMALGISLNQQGKMDSAMLVLRSAMQVFHELEEMQLAWSCLNEMANSYERKKKYREALEIYNKMIALYPYTNDVRGEITTMQRKAHALMNVGRNREAIANLELAMYKADSLGYESFKDTALVYLIRAHASLGDILGSDKYTRELITYIAHRERQKNVDLVSFVDSRYYLEREERKNDALRAEIAATKTVVDRLDLYLRLAVAGIIILMLTLLVAVRRASFPHDIQRTE